MSLTRRYFLQAAAAAGASTLSTQWLHAQESPQSKSPNERIGVAVIGTGSRGSAHISGTAGRNDVEVLYLCDVDERAGVSKLKAVEAKQGREPKFVQDFRRVLDDPAVDCITTATPNHWHSLLSILAMQAGKHVYTEKPVSHNVWEGRQMVNWARKLNKICQCGTQSRSSPSLHAAVQWIREGHLGPIQYAIGTCYKPRKSIGKLDKPLEIPAELDYDMWCGPAAKVDLYRPRLEYDWHWDFNTGNGDMGNQGIHQMDIARWFLGEPALSPVVLSVGGRVGYEDAGNTPNTQIVYHGYEKAPLIFETRGLPSKGLDWKNGMDKYRGSDVGVILQCEKGHVLIDSYTSATAYHPDGEVAQKWKGGGDHFSNFFQAVRSGNHEDLNADILEGHISSALCHTGNISHLLGQKQTSDRIRLDLGRVGPMQDPYSRMLEHLAANNVDVSGSTLTLGPILQMDPEKETFIDNAAADKLLTRDYREGYVVPQG